MPCRNTSSFNAHHVLVRLVGAKVRHSLCLLDPGIPDNNVAQCLSSDTEQRLIVRCSGDNDRFGGVQVLVDTVGLFGDGQRRGRFSVCAGIAGLVDVGLGLEVLDADIGDVLTRSAFRSVA